MALLGNTQTEFRECADGREAIEVYTEQMPGWVIMDIRMPVMDGLTAAASILSRFPGAKIIMLTQDHDPMYMNAAKRVGAVALVLKDNLMELKRIIGSEGSGAGVSAPPPGEQEKL